MVSKSMRRTRDHGIQSYELRPSAGAIDRIDQPGSGMRIVAGAIPDMDIRFGFDEGGEKAFIGRINDGQVIAGNFDFLKFIYPADSAKITDTLVIETFQDRRVGVVASDVQDSQRITNIARKTGTGTIATGAVATLYDDSNPNDAKLIDSFRYNEDGVRNSSNIFLQGWVAAEREFTIWLTGYWDLDNPTANDQPAVIYEADANSSTGIPAGVTSFGQTQESHYWTSQSDVVGVVVHNVRYGLRWPIGGGALFIEATMTEPTMAYHYMLGFGSR